MPEAFKAVSAERRQETVGALNQKLFTAAYNSARLKSATFHLKKINLLNAARATAVLNPVPVLE